MKQEFSTQNVEGHIPSEGGRLYFKKINVDENAHRPTLVFLHDALGSIDQWKSFPEALCVRTGLNGLVFDRLGHGYADPNSAQRDINYMHNEALEILPHVLKELGINKTILVGHSDGGSIALIYASKFNPVGIICIAAHVYVEEKTLEGIREAQIIKPYLIEKLTKYHGQKTEQLFDQWADTWLNESFNEWNIEELLHQINCPALILQGSGDEYASVGHPVRIKHAIGRHARYYMLDDCGHSPHIQTTQAVLEIADAFIKNLDQHTSITINIQ